MFDYLIPAQLTAATVYSILGSVLFVVLLWLFEWLTPFSIKHEIVEEHNTALAIIIGACALSLGMIVSSAIGG